MRPDNRNTAMNLRCSLGSQIPQMSIQSSMCGKSDPRSPHLATYKTANVSVKHFIVMCV